MPDPNTDPSTDRAADRASQQGAPQQQEASLGQLVGEVTADVQKLFRQEFELAKTEFRVEAAKAGKAAGMLGGAGFAGYMVALFASLAAVFALATLVGLGWAALAITGGWAVVGVVLFAIGRARLRGVSPVPQQTVETLKEDARWMRHPTR
ncbi:MAG: phage holin family protein [Streptosporangiales bacterium]|nr:phage holin family protein [Streptosporangiales bacterium]